MPNYDMLPEGSQVKLWINDYKTYHKGDVVPAVWGNKTYVVLLREGGYVRVKDRIIVELVEDRQPRYPEEFPNDLTVNKWGDRVTRNEQMVDPLLSDHPLSYYWYLDEKPDAPPPPLDVIAEVSKFFVNKLNQQ